MNRYAALEATLTSSLSLTRRPVAVAMLDDPPTGVARMQGTQPSGCSFWKLAADGAAFYTEPEHHHNCPIGSYTLNIPLPADREQELPQVLDVMTSLGYLKMAEVPGISRLIRTPAVIAYAPLGDTSVDPDVVVIAGRPGGLMLLHEAALGAGVSVQPLFGRPTCMAIPAAMTGSLASSLGCVGNRIYTDLPEDEFYSVVSGLDLSAIAAGLVTIVSANAALATYHSERLSLRQ